MLESFDQNTREGMCTQSPAVVRYNEEYAEEIKLNEEFDRFVANFQQAYEGPNTARAQTGSKYDDIRELEQSETLAHTHSVFFLQHTAICLRTPMNLETSTFPLAPLSRCVLEETVRALCHPVSLAQDHVGLFVRQSRGGGLPTVLTGGGEREEVELLRPETAQLFRQLE